MGEHTADLEAGIRNAAWMVRHYSRNELRRKQAILKLGEAIRYAFNSCDEYEPLITAVLDGLRPPERRSF